MKSTNLHNKWLHDVDMTTNVLMLIQEERGSIQLSTFSQRDRLWKYWRVSGRLTMLLQFFLVGSFRYPAQACQVQRVFRTGGGGGGGGGGALPGTSSLTPSL